MATTPQPCCRSSEPPVRVAGLIRTRRDRSFCRRHYNPERPAPAISSVACARRRCGWDRRGLAAVERRHHVAGEPAQLLGEFGRGQAFGPMDHEILEAGIARLDRLDPVDHVLRPAAEPRLLLYPLTQGRDGRRRTGAAPSAALLVGVAHKAKRREPFESLV